MYTEEEAKTKWCSEARYVQERMPWKSGGINRWVSDDDTATNPTPSRCLASECMHWRWDSAADFNNPPEKIGYCGLSGKP